LPTLEIHISCAPHTHTYLKFNYIIYQNWEYLIYTLPQSCTPHINAHSLNLLSAPRARCYYHWACMTGSPRASHPQLNYTLIELFSGVGQALRECTEKSAAYSDGWMDSTCLRLLNLSLGSAPKHTHVYYIRAPHRGRSGGVAYICPTSHGVCVCIRTPLYLCAQ